MKEMFGNLSKVLGAVCVGVFAFFTIGWCEAMPPIASSQTTDPELQTYLALYASLGHELDGVIGNEYDANEHKAYLERLEKNLRKGFGEVVLPNMSPSQKLAYIENTIDAQKKRPPRHHLALIPQGADTKESNTAVFVMPIMPNEMRFTQVNVVYRFPSAQAMSEKAHAVLEKFRTVFTAKDGWMVMDPEAIQSSQQANLKNIEAMPDSDDKQKMVALTQKNIKMAQAGQTMFVHGPEANVNILPSLEQSEDGQYRLVVSLARTITQAKSK